MFTLKDTNNLEMVQFLAEQHSIWNWISRTETKLRLC